MAEADDVQAKNEVTWATEEQKIRTARRRFLSRALLAVSGVVALTRRSEALFPLVAAAPQTKPVCPPPSPAFVPVGEITSGNRKLKAVLSVIGGSLNVPGTDQKQMLRFYSGYNTDNPDQKWPVANNAGPGPTFRCELDDSVQITFLNRVDIKNFSRTGLYSAEAGTAKGLCDEFQAGKWYPANDKYPNCFHASSAANVHFHGCHITPSTTGDNVLVNVWPDSKMTDSDIKMIQAWFQEIFDTGVAVPDWTALPPKWREFQMGPEPLNSSDRKGLIARYDDTAVYQGGKLPENLRLWPANQKKINDKNWPQYYAGSYPFCFRISRWNESPDSMGQAPGTHWYHAHKHGSTSINLFNGLAGALIIEDNSPTGYDGALKGFYTKQGQKLDQFVLVLQQITDTITMLVTNRDAGPPPVLVNGQLTPTITMQPGQIQLWRCINATVQAFINAQFNPLQQKTLTGRASNLKVNYRQTAQDGVQFAWENYNAAQNVNPPVKLGPGNRVDLLVQAPLAPGCYALQDAGSGPLLFINVTGATVSMKFPGQADYPPMPGFLADIGSAKPHNPIVYGHRLDPEPSPSDPVFNKATLNQFLIDGEQFDGSVKQRMKLGDAEEWTIGNMDEGRKITHPFHIHVNPFQVVEIFDPAKMIAPLKLKPPYVWFDTFPIPLPSDKYPDGSPRIDPNTNQKTTAMGYFKMRTRFVDFTGLYVQHCHILAHEDRGMMQLVQVCKDTESEQCMKEANAEHH